MVPIRGRQLKAGKNARFATVALAIFFIAASLVVGEFALRAFGLRGHPTNAYFRFDRQLGYRGRSGERLDLPSWDRRGRVVHILNEQGFLSPEFEPGTATNIVLLGDSFVASAGVTPAEGLRAVLEARWRDRTDPNARVHNLALNGYGTDQELMAFQLYGTRLEPDHVVLFFYANDVRDNLVNTHPLEPRYAIGSDRIVSLRSRASIDTAWSTLLGYSALAHAINTVFTGGQGLRTRLPERDYSYAEVDRRVFGDATDPAIDAEWVRIGERLRIFASQAREVGAHPAVVYIPSRDQVNRDGAYPIRTLPYIRHHRVQERLARLSSAHGMELVDLTPVFLQQEAGGQRLYNQADGHWTVLGIRSAAHLLAETLPARTSR